MLLLKIFLGLIGLGIVVLVHELGHFLAAMLVGIDVEAFSIGWGKPILKKKIGAVEYRIGMFPLGGYCKMRGENEFQEAFDNNRNRIESTPGTFFGVKPWRRIVVAFAGPFFNLLFAGIVLSVIWGMGFEVNTMENRIVLASAVNPSERYPADNAGLKSGDRIVDINGTPIATYSDIQESIAVHPEQDLRLTVERNGAMQELTITPSLDKETGAGKIGVYYWAEPIISEMTKGGAAESAGLQAGDRLLKVNGKNIEYSVALIPILQEKPKTLSIEFERGSETLWTNLTPFYTDTSADMGISFQSLQYHTPRLSLFAALAKGGQEMWKTLAVSIKSLALLFKGIDLTKAVSGPVRITYMLGDVAAAGFTESFGVGIRNMADFLCLISIALCVMNLLPLPILDGGLILLFVAEIIKGGPIHPKVISVFQTVGVVLICGLMLFAVFGDVLYLIRG
ncbi:MAG: site-2 protease family protein [Treponema sp.]|jgi:regulator of sigma E protease|nr:site-2 protease family protein [Treponema sp.]